MSDEKLPDCMMPDGADPCIGYQQLFAEVRRLRDCILSARWRLAKGRALWNGPCHECDAALEKALTGREIPYDRHLRERERCVAIIRGVAAAYADRDEAGIGALIANVAIEGINS